MRQYQHLRLSLFLTTVSECPPHRSLFPLLPPPPFLQAQGIRERWPLSRESHFDPNRLLTRFEFGLLELEALIVYK